MLFHDYMSVTSVGESFVMGYGQYGTSIFCLPAEEREYFFRGTGVESGSRLPQPGHRIIAIINTAVLHLEVQDRTVARYCDRYGTHDCPVVLHRHILELPLFMG